MVRMLGLCCVASLAGNRIALAGQGAAVANEPGEPSESEGLRYREEEIHFSNGELNFTGTLTLPSGQGPFPAVILITGSGPQDRDEELFGFKPFRIIADYLARQNVAVLRYDDRGVGGSTGNVSDSTSADFATDVLAAVQYLHGREEIDGAMIGALGHSEGGMIAPIAASSGDLAFLVLIAGPAMPGGEILRRQTELILAADNEPEEKRQIQRRNQELLITAIRTEKGWDNLREIWLKQIRTAVEELPKSRKDEIGDLDAYAAELVEKRMSRMQAPWFRYFISYDPEPALERLEVPVLAIFGELDLQVPAKANSERMARALQRGGNKHFRIEVLPHANHLFQKAGTGSPSEYADLEKAFVPELLPLIGDWIASTVSDLHQGTEKGDRHVEVSGVDSPAAFDVPAHYTKAEYNIPMRDGVRLYTAVYSPLDTSTEYPILLYRTPYSVGAYGADTYPDPARMAPSVDFLENGYIIVLQDIRGTFQSEGTFEVMKPPHIAGSGAGATDESTDTYDTIDWLLKNVENHSGRVGQWGVSYNGWTTLMGMLNRHPALKASSPQASPSDMFIGDDWHHNGAFRLMYAFYWMSLAARERDGPTSQKPEPFEYGTPWGYEFHLNTDVSTAALNDRYFDGQLSMWEDFAEHPNYDNYWRRQNFLQYLDGIDNAVLNVAGWFDAEDFYGPISIYKEIEKRNPGNHSTLVVGPWLHGGWVSMDGSLLGDISFESATSEYYKRNVVFPFFQRYLKDVGEWTAPEAVVFETGTNRWHRFDRWPPTGVHGEALYLRDGGRLSFEPPDETGTRASDSYESDPAKPVPFSTAITTRPGHLWMIEDQRLASTRPDVLTYKTEELTQDVSIAGPIDVNLIVSSTGTDADWFVKLIDVYPGDSSDPEPNPRNVHMGSYQMLVGVEVMRARYRNSFSEPEAMIPNRRTAIRFKIWDKFHTFRRGHSIMVQIHSTWFPAYDRNPQTFTDIYHATPGDYRKAVETVYRARSSASHLILPLIDLPAPDAAHLN